MLNQGEITHIIFNSVSYKSRGKHFLKNMFCVMLESVGHVITCPVCYPLVLSDRLTYFLKSGFDMHFAFNLSVSPSVLH